MSNAIDTSNATPSAESTEPALASDNFNESYELTMPEGMELSKEQRELFDAQAQELKLSGEGAQKLLEISQRNQLSQLQAHKKQVDTWKNEVRQDKEIGGAAFESTISYANAGLQKFDPSGELLTILEQTGYGNNPHVVRFLAAIGRTHSEDKVILGSPSKTEAPRHERLYGKYNSL